MTLWFEVNVGISTKVLPLHVCNQACTLVSILKTVLEESVHPLLRATIIVPGDRAVSVDDETFLQKIAKDLLKSLTRVKLTVHIHNFLSMLDKCHHAYRKSNKTYLIMLLFNNMWKHLCTQHG